MIEHIRRRECDARRQKLQNLPGRISYPRVCASPTKVTHADMRKNAAIGVAHRPPAFPGRSCARDPAPCASGPPRSWRVRTTRCAPPAANAHSGSSASGCAQATLSRADFAAPGGAPQGGGVKDAYFIFFNQPTSMHSTSYLSPGRSGGAPALRRHLLRTRAAKVVRCFVDGNVLQEGCCLAGCCLSV